MKNHAFGWKWVDDDNGNKRRGLIVESGKKKLPKLLPYQCIPQNLNWLEPLDNDYHFEIAEIINKKEKNLIVILVL